MIAVLKRGLDAEITASGLGDALRQHANHLSIDGVEQVANVLGDPGPAQWRPGMPGLSSRESGVDAGSCPYRDVSP
jgi:hypothetical protein